MPGVRPEGKVMNFTINTDLYSHGSTRAFRGLDGVVMVERKRRRSKLNDKGIRIYFTEIEKTTLSVYAGLDAETVRKEVASVLDMGLTATGPAIGSGAKITPSP